MNSNPEPQASPPVEAHPELVCLAQQRVKVAKGPSPLQQSALEERKVAGKEIEPKPKAA